MSSNNEISISQGKWHFRARKKRYTQSNSLEYKQSAYYRPVNEVLSVVVNLRIQVIMVTCVVCGRPPKHVTLIPNDPFFQHLRRWHLRHVLQFLELGAGEVNTFATIWQCHITKTSWQVCSWKWIDLRMCENLARSLRSSLGMVNNLFSCLPAITPNAWS